MRLQEDKGIWYLRVKVKQGKSSQDKNIASFGHEKPTFYNPLLIQGDAIENLKLFKPNSVHLVVTSPPYFNLKEGAWNTYDEYISLLNSVWEGCHSALDIGCRLCVNIGDEYTDVETYGRHYAIPIHADIIKGCQNVGFDYMGSIIWSKSQRLDSSGGGAIMGSYPYPREFLAAYNYEFILLFRKRGRSQKPSDRIKKVSKVKKNDWKTYYNAIWEFKGERQVNHTSAFPEELPKRLIRLFSFVGDVVLDPFMGSGTTPLVAAMWGRKGIGIEINQNYFEIAKERIDNRKIPYDGNLVDNFIF